MPKPAKPRKKSKKVTKTYNIVNEFIDNVARTANNALSLKTSKSALVDLFYFTARNMNCQKLLELCVLAWDEDAALFLALIAHVRDREKKGEIYLGRIMFKWAVMEHPDVMSKSLPFFFEKFGRWDDGFYVTHGTSLWEEFLQICADRIKANDTLCIKWMPSENHKIDKETKGFSHLCRKLNWKPKQLRLQFTKNRVNLVETNLMKKKYGSIVYNHVPGKAMLKYSGKEGTFMRNDKDRFVDWKESLKKPESTAKVNVKTIHPIEIVRTYMERDEEDTLMEEMWKNFKVPDTVEDTIVLSDVSGSMNHPEGKPMAACISLSLLISPHCTYKDTVLTFSEKPEFFHIKGESLYDRMKSLINAPWGGSTNVQIAFEKILEGVQRGLFSKMPKRFIIISDMQFNAADRGHTNFEAAKSMYQDAGYTLPKIVFWNVNGENCKDVPTEHGEENVSLVSGYSATILESVLNDKIITPLMVVKSVLEDQRYKCMRDLVSKDDFDEEEAMDDR